MATFQWISYDVWGNAEDGYTVNSAYLTNEFYEIAEDASDTDILCLIADYPERFEVSNMYNEDVIYIDTVAGEPVGELRQVNPGDTRTQRESGIRGKGYYIAG